ncbi:HAD family hydrolase [Leptothoe spongobia]|uniref:HAD family hydrolase n=1 Tax=Leptothoe spongobia TAU-MAC 1115 TaxID=1967444 RepID=A0A947GG90_9CYAN|nr:HAD family hydrolase [Leptothoe spongobia]MBT9314800.1 HAD family hydrolase [Leptothoe spongobia TAU-MAC 1115]
MQPDVLAFDFDGVICDGLIEYFQTAWRAYGKLFTPETLEPPAGLAEKFYPLRPVIETGWEMPMLLRALIAGKTDEEIIAGWPELALPFLEETNLTKAEAAKTLDGERDHWIATDLDNWLAQHRFYANMLAILQRSLEKRPTYIVSTKEGRFIQQLLKQSGVTMPPETILGKEVKRPKYETLRLLTAKHTIDARNPTLWFIEDRIKALQSVKKQSDLDHVELFLADWGYNLAPERQAAQEDNRIHLLSLDSIVQKFDTE